MNFQKIKRVIYYQSSVHSITRVVCYTQKVTSCTPPEWYVTLVYIPLWGYVGIM